ncbi:MAG: hypothetical protein LBB50_06160 [Oscillospiraceae bacterium]|jgi:hypothetical protein|nr:hypothetical protein [Oscillospiraceae bacterium]
MFFNLFCNNGGTSAANIRFQAINTNGCPVRGAVFRLSCDCGKYMHAISDDSGCVTFRNVCPGAYTLTQVAAPFGYLADGGTHEVCVRPGSCAKIDGLPVQCFRSVQEKEPPSASNTSPTPGVNAIDAETITISGLGEPGCKLDVIFPNGCAYRTRVRRDGTWSVDVPKCCTLEAGDTIRVVQTCGCKYPSETVTFDIL